MFLNKRMQEFFDSRTMSLTFDDVLAQTRPADFYQHEVSIEGRFTRNVPLRVPVIGAAMSSVVGVPMCIALANFGGIGSMPRSLDPEAQAKAVARVKHHIHGFIDEPIPAYADETVEALLARKAEKNWEFDGFPVLASQTDPTLVGVITHSDFKRCDDPQAKIGAVMTKVSDMVIAPSSISKRDAYDLLKRHDKNVLPVVDGGRFLGMYVYADLKRILTGNAHHSVDAQGRLRVAAAVGVGDEALLRAELLVPRGVDLIHIDMAHGAQKSVAETVRALRAKHKDGPDIAVGNVSNFECASYLREAGADGIVNGQGGGSICTTRVVAGIGQPQVTANWECARALHGSGIPFVSDGGIRYSGDAVIALCSGASAIMVGNFLAGTEESPGEKYQNQYGVLVKDYYGMGSERAMKESSASRQRYLHTAGAYVPEGIEGEVPYRGPVAALLEQLVGGLRKGFHYCGARNLDELHAKAHFIQVTGAGLREAHPHNVTMTKQPPNYRGV